MTVLVKTYSPQGTLLSSVSLANGSTLKSQRGVRYEITVDGVAIGANGLIATGKGKSLLIQQSQATQNVTQSDPQPYLELTDFTNDNDVGVLTNLTSQPQSAAGSAYYAPDTRIIWPSNEAAAQWSAATPDPVYFTMGLSGAVAAVAIFSGSGGSSGPAPAPAPKPNTAATIAGLTAGGVIEADPNSPNAINASGTLTVTDPDAAQNTFAGPATTVSKAYGVFGFDPATGKWTYTLDNTRPATLALAAGQTATDNLLVTSADGTASQLITVTITGLDQAAGPITGQTTGRFVEASAGSPQPNPQDNSTTGTLSVQDPDSTGFTPVLAGSAAGSTAHGSYTLSAAGVWSYLPTAGAYASLAAGQIGTDSFIVYSADGSSSQTITVSIVGANDPATGIAPGNTNTGSVSATPSGSNTATPTTAGQLGAVIDPDNTGYAPLASATAAHGTFTLDPATGAWTYTLAANDPQVIALNDALNSPANAPSTLQAGYASQLTDSIVVYSADGTLSQTITVTINGVNDPATAITPVPGATVQTREAGILFVNSAELTPVPTINGQGQVTVTDVDNTGVDASAAATQNALSGAAQALAGSGAAGNAVNVGDSLGGTFAITAAGAWTYTVGNANARVQALNVDGYKDLTTGEYITGEHTLTDSFTIYSADRTITVIGTVSITGTNDYGIALNRFEADLYEHGGINNAAPNTATNTREYSGQSLIASTVSANPDAQGWLQFTDVDNADTSTVGAWNVYKPIVSEYRVLVTSAQPTGSYYSAAARLTLSAIAPEALAFDQTTGRWAFHVDQSSLDIQRLNANELISLGYAAHSLDDTVVQYLNVFIHGADDLATITESNDKYDADEQGSASFQNGGGNIVPPEPGHPGGVAVGQLILTDVDNTIDLDTAFTNATASFARASIGTAAHGTLTIYPDGSYTYEVDNDNPEVQALNNDQSLTDTFTIALAGAASQDITVVIQGHNDKAFGGNGSRGSLFENGGLGGDAYSFSYPVRGTDYTGPTIDNLKIARGRIAYTDVDNPAPAITAGEFAFAEPSVFNQAEVIDSGRDPSSYYSVNPNALLGASFGTFDFDRSTGNWTYEVDQNNLDVQRLNLGQFIKFYYAVRSLDGTVVGSIIIFINGADDAATGGANATGTVQENYGSNNATAGAPSTASGVFTAFDVDNVGFYLRPGATTGRYGDLSFDTTTGAWSYALSAAGQANGAVQALSDSTTTLQDTFTVYRTDELASKTITVNITGGDDLATAMSATATDATVTEFGPGDGTLAGHNASSGDATARGSFRIVDVDGCEANPTAYAIYGTVTVTNVRSGTDAGTILGDWVYTLNPGVFDDNRDLIISDVIFFDSGDFSANASVNVDITFVNDWAYANTAAGAGISANMTARVINLSSLFVDVDGDDSTPFLFNFVSDLDANGAATTIFSAQDASTITLSTAASGGFTFNVNDSTGAHNLHMFY